MTGVRAILGFMFIGLGCSLSLAEEDSFESEFKNIQSQHVPDVGREPIVSAYEELIAKYPDDPRVARAMISLGRLWSQIAVRDMGIVPDKGIGLVWFKRAVESAAPGSELWEEAQYAVCDIVAWVTPEDARRRLEQVQDQFSGSSVRLAKLESNFLHQCLIEEDIDEAEVHCRNLLNWFDDPSRIPEDPIERMEVTSYKRNAGPAYVQAVADHPSLTVPEKIARIQEIVGVIPATVALEKAANELIEKLSREGPGDSRGVGHPALKIEPGLVEE